MNNMFQYYQPNEYDKKDKYCDCVIRAIAKVTDKTWLEVFDDIIPIARKMQTMPNDKPVYEKYLLSKGFIYIGISNTKGVKRPTVDSFTKNNPNIIAVLRVAKHLVACVNGKWYDTNENSANSCLYGYWIKN